MRRVSEWVGVAFNPLCPPFDSDPFSEYHVPDTMVMSKAGYLFIRKYVRSLLSAIMLLNPLHVFYIIHSPTYFLPLHPPTTSLSLPLPSLQSKDRVSSKWDRCYFYTKKNQIYMQPPQKVRERHLFDLLSRLLSLHISLPIFLSPTLFLPAPPSILLSISPPPLYLSSSLSLPLQPPEMLLSLKGAEARQLILMIDGLSFRSITSC